MLAVAAERLHARAFPPRLEADLAPGPAREPGWPLLATPVPAGFPSPADDHIERHLSLDEHLIRHPESTFFMRVQGDALREAGIRDGDLLVVDRALPPTAGSLVVAVVAGEFALRRLGRDAAGRWGLEPDSPPSDRAASAGEPTDLWGVARWVIHRLWPGRNPVS
ncbi:MAG: translesion error-prone DNA polymerase V autoproteolytic subunit [Candidatus Edwardsbacteria bacterium]|jgi:DNA polymerase V|nr:translesion error-prone DNA polymerase V autoproteolytic subunit [Candidatus Edwardsbacteria bacterium]